MRQPQALICCQGLPFPCLSVLHSISTTFAKQELQKGWPFYYDYLFEGSWRGRRNFPLGHSSVPEGPDSGVQYVYGICHHFNGTEQLLQVTEGWRVISSVSRPSSSFATAERAGTEHLGLTGGSQFPPFCRQVWYSSIKSLAEQANTQQVFTGNHWPILTKAWFE